MDDQPLVVLEHDSIMVQPYPVSQPEKIDAAAEADIEWLKALILGVRQIRARLALHPGLQVCGTAIDGVSFNQAIASAMRTGRCLAAGLAR